MLLALPLGELSPKVTERAHAVVLSAKVSSAMRNFPATAKSRPLGEGGCERSEQTEGVSLLPLIPPQARERLRGQKRALWATALSGQTAGLYTAQMHFCCVKSVEVCAVIRYNKTWFIISSCGRAAWHSGRVGGRDGKNCIGGIGGGGQLDPHGL